MSLKHINSLEVFLFVVIFSVPYLFIIKLSSIFGSEALYVSMFTIFITTLIYGLVSGRSCKRLLRSGFLGCAFIIVGTLLFLLLSLFSGYGRLLLFAVGAFIPLIPLALLIGVGLPASLGISVVFLLRPENETKNP
jgi:hypothetical protein